MTRTWYFLFCLSLVLSACAAKEDAPMKPTAEVPATSTATTRGTLSANIDGTAWQAAPAWKKDDDAAEASVDPNGLITIRGTRPEQTTSSTGAAQTVETIEITLKSSQPGTYTLDPAFANLQTATFSIGNDTSQSYFIHEKQSGQAVITQSDGHRLAGTFSFDARNSVGKDIHVTNGTFDVVAKQ